MNINVTSIISTIKSKAIFGLNWLKANGEYKVMGIAGIVGLLTFSSWASLFLALLIGGVYYMAKNKVPQTLLSLVNVDFDKYVVNIVVGLVFASLFLFIV